MKTSLSSNGRVVLPAEFRRQDGIRPGQQFEVERIRAGEYRLRTISASRKPGLLEWLNRCRE